MSTNLKQQIEHIEKEIARLSTERHELKQELLYQMGAVHIGQILSFQHGRNGQRRKGRVTSVFDFCGEPAYHVVSVKADGTDGSTQKIYPYQKPERI